MPLSRRTKVVVVSLGAVIVVAIVAKVLLSILYPTDLRSQLAHVLGIKPDVLWVNLPPAKNRMPGTAFVYQTTLLAIDSVQSDASDVSIGSEFELGWVNSTGSKLNTSADAGFMGLLYGDSGNFKVDLRATKCRSLEVPLDKLKKRLLGSEEIRAQAAQGREPLVVVRSYEGLVTLRVGKSSATSAEVWQKAKDSAKETANFPNSKVAIKGESDDSLEVTFNEPIVFAFEMVAAKLIATHLGADPNDVQFRSIPEPGTETQKKAAVSPDDPRRWALATVAVSDFPQTAWLQQDWNRHSATEMKRMLETFAPTLMNDYRTGPTSLSTAERLLKFANDFGREAKASGARLIVFYYVGHSVTTSNGKILLLQSGVTPQSLKQLVAEQRAPPQGDPSNIGRIVEKARQEDGESALRISELHAALLKSGVPFVILLDGCMENSAVKQTVEGAGFRFDSQHPTLYYVGAEPLTQRLISRVGDSLRDFAAGSSYLSDSNPIVFAAKPGTLAMLTDDPLWEFAAPLAPLAGKVRRILAPSASGNVGSLAELIARSVDMRQGVGEIELSGSISWSDFSAIERAAHTIVPTDKRLPFVDASAAIANRYTPGIGVIEGFYFNATEQRFYLVSQGNDWKVWRWSEASGRQLLAPDLLFPMVSGTPDGRVYLHYDADKTLALVDESGKFHTIKSGIYVERLATGLLPGELLVVTEASNVNEVVPIYVARPGAFVEVDRIRSSGLLSVTPTSPKGVAYTREGSDAINARIEGHDEILAAGLDAPGQLARAGDVLYCLSRSKTRLYRVTGGETMQTDLLVRDGSPLLRPSDRPDGFQSTPVGTLLVTSGDSIIELQPSALGWVSLLHSLAARAPKAAASS